MRFCYGKGVNRCRISAKTIAGALAEARASGQRVERWDSEVPGLHCLASPTGKVVWYVRYRADGGRRRQKLGEAGGTHTDAWARVEARKVLQAVDDGADPAGEAQRVAALPTVGGLLDWYLSTYVLTAGRNGSSISGQGLKNVKSIAKCHLYPRAALMKRKPAEVRPSDLQALRAELTSNNWRHARQILRVCFEHAIELGALPAGANPIDRTKFEPAKKKQRFLTPTERAMVETALGEARDTEAGFSGHLGPSTLRALELLLMSGMRRSDVCGLRWEWVDWKHEVAHLDKGKTGARDVPLTKTAMSYLRREQTRDGLTRTHGLVCPTATGNPIHPSNLTRAWIALRERLAVEHEHPPIRDVRLHDARHSWASDAVSGGVPLYVVGKVLGHSDVKTTARYAHLHDEAVKRGLAEADASIRKAVKTGKRELER
jgi:integrase